MGRRFAHFCSSDHRTCSSWFALLAVQGTLQGTLVRSSQRITHDRKAVLPTPCDERIAMRGFVAMAWRASSCHFWGFTFRHVVTKRTGSLRRARRVSDISLIIFFRLWVVERATTPRGGHGSRKEGYEKKLLVTVTVAHVIWEEVSQCGGIQIHRCPRIFVRGGVYL